MQIFLKKIYILLLRQRYKLFALLQENNLQATKLFSLEKDPQETKNLILDKKYQNVKINLLRNIKAERKYIFDVRKKKYNFANI